MVMLAVYEYISAFVCHIEKDIVFVDLGRIIVTGLPICPEELS